MALSYGFVIQWSPKPGEHHAIESGGHDNSLDAFLEALKQAILCGYMTPKWYQWWRWFERRLSVDGLREKYDIQHKAKEPTYSI